MTDSVTNLIHQYMVNHPANQPQTQGQGNVSNV